jgi:hypothetical protein
MVTPSSTRPQRWPPFARDLEGRPPPTCDLGLSDGGRRPPSSTTTDIAARFGVASSDIDEWQPDDGGFRFGLENFLLFKIDFWC